MYPKPKFKRRVPRARNNPKPTADDICRYCGKPYAQTHECFGGKNRQLSIRYGLQVKLCNSCHRDITENKRLDRVREIKQYGQRLFEQSYGREEFIRIFKRNYL